MKRKPEYIPRAFMWQVLDNFTKADLAEIAWSLSHVTIGLERNDYEIYQRLQHERKCIRNRAQ